MQRKLNKEELVLLCRLAQQTQRYEEMIDYADQVYRCEGQLTSAQRNLCSAGYKSLVGNRRAELRVLSGLEAREESKPTDKYLLPCIRRYREIIELQLRGYCRRILKLVDEHLLPNVKSIEAKVFYLKMKGDYNRYLCEFGDNNPGIETARGSYEEADNLARNNLASTNPIRLGLHLNISVFYYEILSKHERAIELANRAFEDAIANIDNVNEENYKDCTAIMQLLRDNITLWSSEHQDDSYQ